MAAHRRRSSKHRKLTTRRRGLAAVAVGFGIAVAAGHDVAWADTTPSPVGSAGQPNAGVNGPKKPADGPLHVHLHLHLPSSPMTAKSSDSGTTSSAQTDSPAPQQDSTSTAQGRKSRSSTGTGGADSFSAAVVRSLPARIVSRAESRASTERPAIDAPTAPQALTTASPKLAVAVSSVSTTPDPPGPLSPIAKLAEAPGRFVNVVLQALDFTSSSKGPQSPIDFAPLDEAFFAGFRRIEEAVGLTKPPAVEPVLSHQEYDLPPDAEKTPTVAQFLNAATAEYVLGGTPAGLKPFTVDGKQMTSTNELTGESAKAWVTPDNQIIIAYQGTTGGTNLLFNPLIAITQILTDTQVIFTDTTPQAFTDSVAFEKQVESAAAEQGYDKSDIFVTGHSLGGWEAQYVAQQTGVGGIGFEGPGLNSKVDGNGADSGFVNIETYGDTAAYLATDLPGLQPFMPAYVPGGGSKPHYGSIIMVGDPNDTIPLMNAASLWGPNPIGDVIFAVDILGNFFEHHLPGMQAYNLDVDPDPGVVPWLGATSGDVNEGWGDLTIPELKAAASDAGVLITP